MEGPFYSVLAICLLLGLGFVYLSWWSQKLGPYLSFALGMGHLLSEANALWAAHLIMNFNRDHSPLLEDALLLGMVAKVAWFGYPNIVAGFTRWGTLAMLLKPINVIAWIWASPHFSLSSLYVAGVLPNGTLPAVCPQVQGLDAPNPTPVLLHIQICEDHIVISHGRPPLAIRDTALQLNGPEPKPPTETGPDITGSQNSKKLNMDFLQSARRGDSDESSFALCLAHTF